MQLQSALTAVWVVLAIVWLFGALTAKRTARQQTPVSRLLHMAALVLMGLLMVSPLFLFWPLTVRLIPASEEINVVGLALTIAGAAFAIWARFSIGRNWSGEVTVKSDHKLITGGPYRLVRHPIYSGILVALLGTALMIGEVRGFLAVLIAAVAWHLKSRMEEQFMVEQFGSHYVAYRQRVKALVPFIL